MKSGQCPKCGSFDVRLGAYVPNKQGTYFSNTIPISGGIYPRQVALDNYVCLNCGYVESYISDREMLQRIAEKWPRVSDNEP